MPSSPALSDPRPLRAASLIGPLATLALFVTLASRTGPGEPSRALDALLVLATAAPLAAVWLIAAWGFGRPLRHWLLPAAPDGPWVQLGLGIAALLTLDAALGRLGLLGLAAPIAAWIILIAGLFLAVDQGMRAARAKSARRSRPAPWLPWLAAPAVATLLVASTSAPGWLWASEFGGYDALSYHLQLPKEWLGLGRIAGLEHNVYSFFPGYVEAAYLHLATLTGSTVSAAAACQLLHAGLAIIAAALTGRLAHRLLGRVAGQVTFVLVLATPWTIVAGSLAYNEMAVLVLLATGLLVFLQPGAGRNRRAVALGGIVAAACGAKLTAAGFVAAPLLILYLWTTPARRWPANAAAALVAGLVIGSPYLVSNLVATGNPFFPFLTGIFGSGHWTAEQAMIWRGAHAGDGTLGSRLVEAWRQLPFYGLGPAPEANEPWRPQWSILPWLAAVGAIVALRARALRPWAFKLAVVLLVQVVFWIGFTHVKSRFMLPGVVPMVLLVVMGFDVVRDRWPGASRAWQVAGATALLALSCVGPWIYLGEQNRAPAAMIGRTGFLTGEALSEEGRRALGALVAPSVAVNRLLPDGSRVLLVGEAAPFYFDLDRIAYQTTWDRGLLSRIVRDHPDDPAAWPAALRAAGFTHLLLRLDMLRRWEESGWNDPMLDADALAAAFDAHARVVFDYEQATPDPASRTRWAVVYGVE